MINFLFWISGFAYLFKEMNADSLIILQSILIGIMLITKQTEQRIIIGIFTFITAFLSSLGLLTLGIYLFLLILGSTIAVLNYFAPEIVTSTLNPYTIHLAFYCGQKGSTKMLIGRIIGFMPVKSLCVVAKDKGLRIKDGVFTVIPAASINASDSYLVIDTHVPADDNFIEKMLSFSGIKSRKSMTSASCIGIIIDLLRLIGEDFKPNNILEYVPSIYLRKVLKHGRKKVNGNDSI